jgi:transcriptional regulator with XRE-family HTH domain
MNADEFKAALRALGWKQADLARRVEVAPTTVSRWIDGDGVPGPVAAYLGIALQLQRLYAEFVAPPARERKQREARPNKAAGGAAK